MAHKEVTAVLGEYINAKGEVKKRYQKIGAIIDTKHGPMLKLDVIPLKWEGYAYINEPFDEKSPRSQRQAPQNDGFPDDMPF
jgi:hypothetical protein